MTGVGMLFVPLNNAAYLFLPARQVNNAAGLFNMLERGGSLGIAIVEVLVNRRGQFHQLRLAEHVTLLNPAVIRLDGDGPFVTGEGIFRPIEIL